MDPQYILPIVTSQHFLDVRFLEKVNGEWEIVYLSHVNFASYEEEKEDDGESETED